MKSFTPNLKGTLNGHVTSIILTRSDDPAAFQLRIPVDPPPSAFIASGILIQRPGELSPDLGGVFEMIAANLGVFDIATDLPSRPRVVLPLALTGKHDWFRPHNCY